jgi:hypothetical protein
VSNITTFPAWFMVINRRRPSSFSPSLHFRLGLVYCQKEGMYREAGGDAKSRGLVRESTETLIGLAQASGMAGDPSAMQKIIRELESATRYVPPYDLARTYACVKDQEQAFAWLEKA